MPITLYHFFRYPLYSLLLNLLVLPLITPLFLLGAAGLWVTALFPALSSVAATWLLIPCRWILQIYDLLCQVSLALPHASALIGRPTLLRISLYYCVLGLVCLRKQRTAPLVLITLLAILLLPLPHRSLSVTFLDVGQGDCAFLETPKGTTILIDSGSSDLDRMAEERLRPFLESQGVDHLDYVFLSHTDEDHFNGIVQWLDLGGSIGTAVLPALPDSLVSSPSYQHAITLLTSYQVPILYFSQGMSWQEEELTLTCLAPVSPSHPHSSLYQDLNTASQVLLLQYQEIHILFTGDCEKEGEKLLLDYLQEQNLTCHILKAGHHGSNFATSQALLTQLHPQAVIVSCGDELNHILHHGLCCWLCQLLHRQEPLHRELWLDSYTCTLRVTHVVGVSLYLLHQTCLLQLNLNLLAALETIHADIHSNLVVDRTVVVEDVD